MRVTYKNLGAMIARDIHEACSKAEEMGREIDVIYLHEDEYAAFRTWLFNELNCRYQDYISSYTTVRYNGVTIRRET